MTAESSDERIRPTEPRIEPITEFDGELAEIMATALTHDGKPLNIFGTLGKHPKLLKRFNLLGGFLLNKGLVPARERELVILRVGANARAEYEFGQHTVIGRDCGLTDDEIAALTRDPTATPGPPTTVRSSHSPTISTPTTASPTTRGSDLATSLGRRPARRAAGRRRLLPTRVGLPEQHGRPARRGHPGISHAR